MWYSAFLGPFYGAIAVPSVTCIVVFVVVVVVVVIVVVVDMDVQVACDSSDTWLMAM